ncbi:MAG: hypothetical protein ACK55I_32755, partial [bacterium]
NINYITHYMIRWKLEDGVTSKMLYEICKILDISHYSYDITNKCFLKYVSKNKNCPALVYYCVNAHMYWIENKEEALILIRKSQSVEHKIKSYCLDDETHAEANIYETKKIVEDIDISDITQDQYKNTVCIYGKSNLNEELDMIIEQYNYIP